MLCAPVAAIDMTKENFERQKQSLLADLDKWRHESETASHSYSHLYTRISLLEYPVQVEQQGAISYYLRDSYDGNEQIAEQVFQLLGKY